MDIKTIRHPTGTHKREVAERQTLAKDRKSTGPKSQERRRSGCPNRRLPDRSPSRRQPRPGGQAPSAASRCVTCFRTPSLGASTDHPECTLSATSRPDLRPCGLAPDHVPAHATHFCVHAPFRGAAGHPAFPGLHPAPARFRGTRSQTFGLALVELDHVPSR